MTDDWKKRGAALFDMDGTLLPWDTQYVFSCFVVRRHPWRRLLIFLFLACIPLYILRIWDENRMKRAYLMYLWGLPAETVREYGRKFAEMAQEWIYPELKERLAEYRKKGYLCLMVSASPSFYVKPLGELLGFDEILGTDVLLEERMPAMPKLPNGNNKGAVKVERLRERNVLPEHGVLENAVAYSDSAAGFAHAAFLQAEGFGESFSCPERRQASGWCGVSVSSKALEGKVWQDMENWIFCHGAGGCK